MRYIKKKPKSILNKVNNSSQNTSLNSNYFSKGDDTNIDSVPWLVGAHSISSEDNYKFVIIHEVLKPEPKKIEEARGLITSDYQTYLETLWVQELRGKYNYVVNQDLLVKLKNNVEQ